ncbi:MAG: hypothetical protein ABIE68_00910 [bacterium]
MYKTATRWVAIILTASVILFTLMAILAIWDVLDGDIAWKSLSTLSVILFASLISLVIIKIIKNKGGSDKNLDL